MALASTLIMTARRMRKAVTNGLSHPCYVRLNRFVNTSVLHFKIRQFIVRHFVGIYIVYNMSFDNRASYNLAFGKKRSTLVSALTGQVKESIKKCVQTNFFKNLIWNSKSDLLVVEVWRWLALRNFFFLNFEKNDLAFQTNTQKENFNSKWKYKFLF
jgi:hypothetical protein